MIIRWATTAPNQRPGYRHHTHSADDGQIGWRVHALLMPNDRKSKLQNREYGKFKAVCGMRPRHGWGMDAFIDEPCANCLKQLEKRKLHHLRDENDKPEPVLTKRKRRDSAKVRAMLSRYTKENAEL